MLLKFSICVNFSPVGDICVYLARIYLEQPWGTCYKAKSAGMGVCIR